VKLHLQRAKDIHTTNINRTKKKILDSS